jgi:hypothetical protein
MSVSDNAVQQTQDSLLVESTEDSSPLLFSQIKWKLPTPRCLILSKKLRSRIGKRSRYDGIILQKLQLPKSILLG